MSKKGMASGSLAGMAHRIPVGAGNGLPLKSARPGSKLVHKTPVKTLPLKKSK